MCTHQLTSHQFPQGMEASLKQIGCIHTYDWLVDLLISATLTWSRMSSLFLCCHSLISARSCCCTWYSIVLYLSKVTEHLDWCLTLHLLELSGLLFDHIENVVHILQNFDNISMNIIHPEISRLFLNDITRWSSSPSLQKKYWMLGVVGEKAELLLVTKAPSGWPPVLVSHILQLPVLCQEHGQPCPLDNLLGKVNVGTRHIILY